MDQWMVAFTGNVKTWPFQTLCVYDWLKKLAPKIVDRSLDPSDPGSG